MRQKRNTAWTPFPNTGQLSLRYNIASEVAGAERKIGGMGAPLTHLAHFFELSVTQNIEVPSRFAEAQHASWPHIARHRGDLEIIKSELVRLNQEKLRQCVHDQQSEFFDRQRGAKVPNPRAPRVWTRPWKRARDATGYSSERRSRRD